MHFYRLLFYCDVLVSHHQLYTQNKIHPWSYVIAYVSYVFYFCAFCFDRHNVCSPIHSKPNLYIKVFKLKRGIRTSAGLEDDFDWFGLGTGWAGEIVPASLICVSVNCFEFFLVVPFPEPVSYNSYWANKLQINCSAFIFDLVWSKDITTTMIINRNRIATFTIETKRKCCMYPFHPSDGMTVADDVRSMVDQ